MIETINVAPGQAFARRITTTVQDVTVRIAVRWLDRLGRWQVQISTADGVALTGWWLVEGGGEIPIDTRQTGAPPGSWLWLGGTEYSRLDLGEALQLVYVSG